MHFHLPKPLHGWREFAGEVGIIVLGVLIALGAEQLVERFQTRAELRETEAAMRSELRDDNLPQAYSRVAVHDCLVDQLDQIESAVASGADRARVLALARSYRPPYRTWDDVAWRAALQSPAFVHAGAKRMIDWSTIYVVIPVLTNSASREQSELPDLWQAMPGSGPLSQSQQDRLLHSIAVLRRENFQMAAGTLYLIKETDDAGLRLSSAEQAQVLTEARQVYGSSCVKKPSLSLLAAPGQLSRSNFRY